MSKMDLCGTSLVTRIAADLDFMPCAAFLIDRQGSGFGYRRANAAYLHLHDGADGDACDQQIALGLRRAAIREERFRQCFDMATPVTFSEPGFGGSDAHQIDLVPLPDAAGRPLALLGVIRPQGTDSAAKFAGYERSLMREREVLTKQIDRLARVQGLLERRGDQDQVTALLAEMHEDLDDALTQLGRDYQLPQGPVNNDLVQLCCALSDILDPLRQWRISYDEAEIEAEPSLLHQALRTLVGQAMQYGRDWICIDAGPEAEGFISLSVTTAMSASCEAGVEFHSMRASQLAPGLAGRLASMGGKLGLIVDRARDELVLCATLPGRVLWQDRGWGAFDQAG